MTLARLGRYQITGTLGQGAMGTVYSAHDPLIDRVVAIKTVSCAGLTPQETEAFEERFYREAKSAGRLNHPNIVTIHDVGRSDDLAYIAMEFLSGRSLRDLLDSGVVLPLERIARIVIEIADGLAFAHANDVVHRDIKPANIMVLDNNTVKIADFGVALLADGAHAVAGTAQGSPRYMSPEQAMGKTPDGRSDIFSLGVVLYEMLTGRPAFDGGSVGDILEQVLRSAPPLPSTFLPELPHGFDRIVARAMAKDPDKRYQKASDMAAHLRKYRRIVIQARREQEKTVGINCPAATPPAIGPGAETVQIRPVIRTMVQTGASTKGRALHWAPVVAVLVFLALGGGWAWRYHFSGQKPSAGGSALVLAVTTTLALPTQTLAASPATTTTLRVLTETTVPPAPIKKEAGTPPVAVAPAASVSKAEQTESQPAAQVGEGRLRLAVSPWGEVLVDGRKMGVSPPLSVVRLPAGRHDVEIRNPGFRSYRKTIRLAPNARVRIKHKFE